MNTTPQVLRSGRFVMVSERTASTLSPGPGRSSPYDQAHRARARPSSSFGPTATWPGPPTARIPPTSRRRSSTGAARVRMVERSTRRYDRAVRADRGELIGRREILNALDDLLAAAHARRSGTLVLRGEAGIGKSAMLAYAAGRADGMVVLTATGTQSETELAFAGLHQLLWPVLPGIGQLSAPQRHALQTAFGLGSVSGEGPPDRFLAAAATLTLLADAAENQPVLCLLDDVQWIDEPTVEALIFVARRLHVEGIVLIFALRPDPARPRHPTEALGVHPLDGLDEESAVELVLQWYGDRLSPPVARDLAQRTGGSPLALREIPPSLSEAEQAGREPLPTALPLGPGLEETFLHQVNRLPAEAQRFLEVVSADDSGQLDLILRAAAPIGLAEAEPAERAALVRIDGNRVSLRHPLLRSAIYRQLSASRRSELHRKLADAAVDDVPERRAWHLAAAATGPDADAAAALEMTADRARKRAGHAAAARAMARAAALSVDGDNRARRLMVAAEDAWLAGQPERARQLLDQAGELGPADDPARRAKLLGLMETRTGTPARAIDPLLNAAANTRNGLEALELMMLASEAAAYTGDTGRLVHIGHLAAATPEPAGNQANFLRNALMGTSALLSGEVTTGLAHLAVAERCAQSFDDPTYLRWATSTAIYAGSRDAEERYLKLVERNRADGAVGAMPYGLEYAAVMHALAGRFNEAMTEADEGLRLARDTGQEASVGNLLAASAIVAALQGREQQCRHFADEALALAVPRGLGITAGFTGWALALLDLGMGRSDLALDRYLALVAAGPGAGHPVVAMASLSQLVQAAVYAGRAEEGRRVIERFGPWIEETGPHYAAMLAYARGLLAVGADCEPHFDKALTWLTHGSMPVPQAWVHLAYGEYLRRARRRASARQHLRAALELFEAVGAEPWADRARLELRASGETARARDLSAATQLTPQELQIVRSVADGLSNREIGARLFLSPRTVEYHLRKVFQKLSITSRTELARLDLLN